MVKIQVNGQGKAYIANGNALLAKEDNGQYLIRVLDYDGTVLKREWHNEGETFTLPTPPTNDKLTFQTWSSPKVITNNQITVPACDMDIGAIYTTKSGLNEFDIELNATTGLEVTLNIDGTKDWGDGTSDNLTTHTYANYGEYTIATDGTVITAGTTTNMFGTSDYNESVREVRTATIATLPAYCFYRARGLTRISLSNSLTTISGYCFYVARSLRTIIIPPSVTSTIGVDAFLQAYSLTNVIFPSSGISTSNHIFNSCYSLDRVVLPENTVSVGTNFFRTCYGLHNVTFLNPTMTMGNNGFNGCTSIPKVKFLKNKGVGTNMFNGCYALEELDLSENTQLVVLADVNALTSAPSYLRILVPKSLENTYKTATNWSTYADNIVGV